jgi:hypothetical protein
MGSPLMVLALLAAHCILQSTDRVLHLAGSLFGLAFSFQLLVAEDLPCGFFHRSFGLLCPLIRSLSIADILVIYLLGVYGPHQCKPCEQYCSEMHGAKGHYACLRGVPIE